MADIELAEVIMGIAGLILAVVLRYAPGLAPRYEALGGEWKRLVALGLLVVASVGIFAAGCGGLYEAVVECSQGGALSLARGFLFALTTNQSAANILPKSESVVIAAGKLISERAMKQMQEPKG